MTKENDMTDENFVRNGDFKNGLISWEKPSDGVEAASVCKTAALFSSRNILLRQLVAGEEVGKYLEPGVYECRFRAMRLDTSGSDTLDGYATIQADFWDGGNPNLGLGTTLQLKHGATNWEQGVFQISVTQPVNALTLILSADSRDSNDEPSDRVRIAITDVELVKKS